MAQESATKIVKLTDPLYELLRDVLKEQERSAENAMAKFAYGQLREAVDQAEDFEPILEVDAPNLNGHAKKRGARLKAVPVAERRKVLGKGFEPDTVEIIALLADGESLELVAGCAGKAVAHVRNTEMRYREEIAYLASLPPGQARYDYIQQRFGLGGGSVMPATIGERVSAAKKG